MTFIPRFDPKAKQNLQVTSRMAPGDEKGDDAEPVRSCPQMTGHGAKFGRKKEAAIAALLVQRNHEEAARAVGISPKTLLRWMKDPEFDADYRAARRAAFSQSVGRLQQASSAAVSTLLKLMVDGTTPASTRARAADSVLNHAAKAIELEDIEARVAELERAAEASKTKGEP